ncbi:CBS domain-containing protein [Desulfurobacterium thermolithotrophum]|uniref:CBS domain-containing protein n=1 Tax=Desulfurobacterium thermolithotrophum TaxID=64160 RepID=UPI0013D55BE2|nr:CBS domain-containing protein [Desulfurobacterium thermolithotrophum]
MGIVITTHKNMDLDALGAVIAAKKLYPDATVVLPGTKGNDVVKLLSENPELIDFVEEENFNPQSVKKIVIVDTDNINRIPDSIRKLIKEKNVETIVYDHHSAEFSFKDIEHHYKASGSVTSLMVLLLKGKGITPTPIEASVMLAGIYSDTGNFRFSSTSPIDFLAAAYLVSIGANIEFVKKYLPSDLSDKELDILKNLKDNLKITEVHGNLIGITYKRFDSYIKDISSLVSKLLEISGLPAIIAVLEFEGSVSLIGRSKTPKVDVSKVTEYFGGGGHVEAASASIKGKTVFEVLEELKKVLEEVVEPLKKAKDIMTYPPIVVSFDSSIEKARTTLMKNSINAAPVVDKKGNIVGVVNRTLIDKAIYMGLKEEPIFEIMERDFLQVFPETPIGDVEKIIIDRHQSFVPVVQDGKPIGVITRTDILMNLYKDEISNISKFYEKRVLSSPKYKNIVQKLKESLPKELLFLIKKIGEFADEFGVNAYIVGGFVRDLILGRKNFDVDIVIEGDATEFAKKIAKKANAKVHTFERFKTATVVFPDGFRIDFASARTEVYKAPGALPEVDMAPLKKDLMRRDFTINTLAIKLNKKEFGKLIDFFGGLRDIKDRKIRILHSLSFVEDPTRILRALRFATRYRFELGKHTEKLLKIAVQRKLFKTVEGQRIYHELKQIFLEDNPLRVVNKLAYYKVLSSIFPNIVWDKKKKDLFERIRKVIIWHKLNFQEKEIRYDLLYFGALLIGQSFQKIDNYLDNLLVPEKDREILKEILLKASYLLKEVNKERKNSEIYRLVSRLKEEVLLFAASLTEEEWKREKILEYLKSWRFIKPAVTGEDLKAIGLKPGPIFREILNELKYKIIDKEIPEDKEKQLDFVKFLIKEEEKYAKR